MRELYDIMAAEGATGGFVITSGTFSKEAQAFASGSSVQLINGDHLARIIKGTAPQRTPAPATALIVAPLVDRSTPHCPLCGLHIAGRVAKRGANVGCVSGGAVATRHAKELPPARRGECFCLKHDIACFLAAPAGARVIPSHTSGPDPLPDRLHGH